MKEPEIIVIGAGAAGLICASELGKAGKKVMVLEARERLGGRIHTITNSNFPLAVELGAEFVHGDLSLTKKLMKEGAIEYYAMEGNMWRSENGEFTEQDDFMEHLDFVINQLKTLQIDISVADFLQFNLKEEKYNKLCQSLKNYVEGYHAADTKHASSFALLQELCEEEDDQYRMRGGYKKLVDHLANECTKGGCIFKLETIAKNSMG